MDRAYFSLMRRGLYAQFNSIRAIMIRDMMVRYGRNNLGFLWVVIEPMILTGFVLVLFSFTKATHEKGTHVITMVLTGYMPLTMWRHTTNNGIHLLRRSIGLLYHRNTTTLDVFWARMFIEGIGTTAALLSVYLTLLAAGVIQSVADWGLLVAAWLNLWLYGSSVALIIAALTEWSETAERFIQPFQYIMVPLSGIFFMVDWLPYEMQKVVQWLPLTNCVEMFRAGFFGDIVRTHYDPYYPLYWTIFLLWSGLYLFARARENLHAE